MFIVLSKKRLVAAEKFLVTATKNVSVVPNFVAVTKPFFPVKCNTRGRKFFRNDRAELGVF